MMLPKYLKAVALSILAVLLIISRANGQTTAPKTQTAQPWLQPFTPTDKSFSVEMPVGVQLEHDSVLSDEPFSGENYVSFGPPAYFYLVSVACANPSRPLKISANAYFAALYEAGGGGRRVSTKQITVDGFAGGEVTATKPGDAGFTRWIAAGPRIYILNLITSGDEGAATAAKRFFESFHINRRGNVPLPECPSAAGRLPTATVGKIRLVEFPDYWISNQKGFENTLLSAPRGYQIRSRRTALSEEWLFAAFDYDEADLDSFARNYYAVLLSDPVKISPLTRSAWTAAKAISTVAKEVFRGDDKEPATFEYRGHKYPKAAEHWGTVTVSPGGKWVAIYSYSGENTPATFIGGGVPREGDLFWDVYDAETGRKVLSWTAKSVSNPALLGEGTAWIKDRYIVMPFQSNLKACVIGILPE